MNPDEGMGEAALRLTALPRYWHTLRHLRAVQFYGRLWFRLARPRPDLAAPPPLRARGGAWQPPACREPSLLDAGDFLFLGEPGALSEIGWDGPQREKLWRYNQHYFDDLNARDAAQRRDWQRALLIDWVAANPPATGNGWEPYPTSLRIVNWIKWALAGNALPEACLHSLAVQVRWLTRRLEIHLLGNHLFANAKALVFAGLFFDGPEAARWLDEGMRILGREVPEQILADGGHFERSTMYHALALEDMLDLLNLTTTQAPAGRPWTAQLAAWPELVSRMAHWLRTMCHPDGDIAFFNDAALGIAPAPAELFAYAARLGCATPEALPDVVRLEDSGYLRVSRGEAVLLIDVAPVGPDYLPGHAHADTLSFELSVGGRRVIVNGGTSRYGGGPERLAQRGTAAHSTVQLDGCDSSEVWGGFRVARRAYPFDVAVSQDADAVTIEAAHDGYARLPGRPIHRRRWRLGDGRLEVTDQIEGRCTQAVARYHFHPAVSASREGLDGSASWGGTRAEWRADAREAELIATEWHPRFGQSIPSVSLALNLNPSTTPARLRFELVWRRSERHPCAS